MSLWKIRFYNLPSALEFLAKVKLSRKNEIRVWCKEISVGTREYVLASAEVFFDNTVHRNPGDKSWYEVILLDRNTHLYFDVDVEPDQWPDSSPDEQIHQLMDLLIGFCRERHKFQLLPSDIVILDSTTPKKTSFHVIIGTIILANNKTGNQFCGDLESFIAEQRKEKTRHVFSHTSKLSILDRSVYKKNQNMRLIYSTKFKYRGQENPPVFTKYQLWPARESESSFAFFKRTLIQTKFTRVLAEEFPDRILAWGFDNPMQTVTNLAPNSNGRFARLIEERGVNAPIVSEDLQLPALLLQYLQSFVEEWGGTHVKEIKRMNQTNLLSMHISGTRFCKRVQRQHKKNNIYFVLNQRTGRIWQKCHDWECREFKSSPEVVPAWALDETMSPDEDFFAIKL